MANKYRVGTGTGWTNANSWALSSGGTDFTTTAVQGDNAFFDANTPAVAMQLGGAACTNLDTTGYTGTLILNGVFTLYGNFTLTVPITGGGIFTTAGNTGGSFTMDTRGNLISPELNFANNSATVYTLLSDLRVLIGQIYTASVLQTNGFKITATTSFTVNAGTVLSPSTSIIDTPSFTVVPTATFQNGQDSTIICRTTFAGGGKTYGQVTVNAPAAVATSTITGANTYAIGLTYNALAASKLTVDATPQTIGTFTVNGHNDYPLITTTLASCNISASTTDLDLCLFQKINALGTAGWGTEGGAFGGIGNTTGFNFTPPISDTLNTSGNWFTGTLWGAGRPPLPQDEVHIHSTGTAISITNTADRVIYAGSLSITADAPANITLNLGTDKLTLLNGGYSVGENVTILGTFYIVFQALTSNTYHISSLIAGRVASSITISGTTATGSTYIVDTDIYIPIMIHLGGSLILSETCDIFRTDSFRCNGSITRTLDLGTATISLLGTSGTMWNLSSTGLTPLNFENSIISFDASLTSGGFTGGSLSYGTLRYNGTSNTLYSILGSNTFKTIISNQPTGFGVSFGPSTVTTVENFLISGRRGAVVTLQTTSGVGNLNKSGGGIYSSEYLTINSVTASPLNTWYAGRNSTLLGTTTGWNLNYPPGEGPTTGLFFGIGF